MSDYIPHLRFRDESPGARQQADAERRRLEERLDREMRSRDARMREHAESERPEREAALRREVELSAAAQRRVEEFSNAPADERARRFARAAREYGAAAARGEAASGDFTVFMMLGSSGMKPEAAQVVMALVGIAITGAIDELNSGRKPK